jgi:hypothetical protein
LAAEATELRALRALVIGGPRLREPIASALRAAGATVVMWEDAPAPGLRVDEMFRRVLPEVDVVIALLERESSNGNVFYELGLASGFGKPVLLVVPPGAKVPTDLAGALTVRPGDKPEEAVTFALAHWLRSAAHSQAPRWPPVARATLGPEADRLRDRLAEFDAIGGGGREVDLISIIADTLRGIGATVGGPEVGQPRFDLGVWVDELESLTGNPLVVEVKRSLSTQDELDIALTQIRRYLSDIPARAALLVHGGRELPAPLRDSVRSDAPVAVLSARTLIDELELMPLGEVLTRAGLSRYRY